MKIKTKQETWLKTSTAQSDSLGEGQKFRVPEGTELELVDETTTDGHWRVALYIYTGHARLSSPPPPPREEIEERSPRQISERGLELIKRFEGLRLETYDDGVGVPTIGYGHTATAAWGMRISRERAEELLEKDVERFERAVNRLVEVPLSQNQFDALVSFSFNVGTNALSQSTLLRRLNAGDYQGAASEFTRWVYAGGRRLEGLVSRRKAERSLFLESTPERAIDWSDPTAKVSEFFSVTEVTQNDPRRVPKALEIENNILELAKQLDEIRRAWGSPVGVTSWYRPPEVNRQVGGVSNSRHLHGDAADIFPIGGNIHEFQDWLDKGLWSDRALGYGASRGFVHVDLRSGRIRWNY